MKKLVLVCGVFLLLVVGYFAFGLVQEGFSSTNTMQEKINYEFALKLNKELPSETLFDNTNNFRSDGEIYVSIDYSSYHEDKLEEELQLSQFSKEKDLNMENSLKAKLEEREVSKEKFPNFEDTYYWKKAEHELNTMYMVYAPNTSKLYVYGDII